MPPLPPPEDDDYDSAADSDFDASLSPSSGDDSDNDAAGDAGRKRKQDKDGDLEMGSGDEGVVAQGRKKRQKKNRKGGGKGYGGGEAADVEGGDEDEDEDVAGGIRVRLRSGRGGEAAKKAAVPKASAATANIDEIWALMNDPSLQSARPPNSGESTKEADTTRPTPSIQSRKTGEDSEKQNDSTTQAAAPLLNEPEPTISIPHTYTFAGQTTTSTKTVPLSSPAAQAYLASLKQTSSATGPDTQTQTQNGDGRTAKEGPPLRRPLARKSLFEPNPTCFLASRGHILAPRADLPRSIGGQHSLKDGIGPQTASDKENASLNATFPRLPQKASKKDKGEKLNTVEKSKLDWEAEVDRLGLREELEKAEKDRGSYLGRREFLDRVEMAEEERARIARLAGSGS